MKGRRFAPWTAPGRSEGMAIYEGKGGMQIRSYSDFVSHLIAFDSIALRPKPGHSGRACRAEREPFGHTGRLEPQPRGAVTRRVVAQRRSRVSGLTRPLAEAISDSAWSCLSDSAAQRFSQRNAYSALLHFRSGFSHGP